MNGKHFANGLGTVVARLICLIIVLAAWPVGAQTVAYVHTDALGSVVAKTDANGNVVERYDYEPYGAPVGAGVADGPAYAGHVSDSATGLSYMQQRYMDPQLGVFLSVDPVTAYQKPVDQFNRYRYANGNPYTVVDPDGEAGKVAWLVRLTANQAKKVARLTQEQAVRARRAQQNVVADRRQMASQIETSAHGTEGKLKHTGHELDGGGTGLPHYQTEGVRGHSFWGKVSVGALAVAGTLEQAADAAEYIPEAAPRPADQSDIARWNGVMGAISEKTGLPMPGVKMGEDGGFQGYFRVDGRLDSKRLDKELAKGK